jgi:hypothetical protein
MNEQIVEKQIFVTSNSAYTSPTVPLDSVVGRATSIEMDQKTGDIYVNWELLPKESYYTANINNLEISPVGIGKVDEHGVVTEYKLISFSIQPK